MDDPIHVFKHEDMNKSTCHLLWQVWELWKEGRCMEIVEESIVVSDNDPQSLTEVLKWTQIGLLCIQELATD